MSDRLEIYYQERDLLVASKVKRGWLKSRLACEAKISIIKLKFLDLKIISLQ